MAQKGIHNKNKIRFLSRNSAPVITAGTNSQKPVYFAMKSANMLRTTPIPKMYLTGKQMLFP
jgi:hypothetical protein